MRRAFHHSRREAGIAIGWSAWLNSAIAVIGLAGCHSLPAACDRDCVSSKVAARTGHALLQDSDYGQIVYPNGASLSRVSNWAVRASSSRFSCARLSSVMS